LPSQANPVNLINWYFRNTKHKIRQEAAVDSSL
jgi:hypothetical protein